MNDMNATSSLFQVAGEGMAKHSSAEIGLQKHTQTGCILEPDEYGHPKK